MTEGKERRQQNKPMTKKMKSKNVPIWQRCSCPTCTDRQLQSLAIDERLERIASLIQDAIRQQCWPTAARRTSELLQELNAHKVSPGRSSICEINPREALSGTSGFSSDLDFLKQCGIAGLE